MRVIYLGLLAVMVLARALPAAAHHSTAFYAADVTELDGELLDVSWRNPHTRYTLRVKTASGAEELWSLEGSSIYNLRRSGISRDLFKTGDHVRVAGHRSTLKPFELQVTNMLFPDGREALLWPGTAPVWREDAFGVKDQYAGALTGADTLAANRGIFRVWTVPRDVARDLYLPFRPQAIAARSKYNMLDNFATRCEPEGMPRIMVNPHPFEFVDHGSEITLRTEFYDIERTIHMGQSEPPADTPASRLGYSVGRWENGVLVVTTTRLNWPYFDNIGTPQSPAVRVVERYTLAADQHRLDYKIEVTDPATFSEPATMAGYWLALGDKIRPYECEPAPR